MELRHIRYFVAAAEEENFHRAAERLCVVTPALSRRIHDLEDELGVQLFERQQKRVKLSPMGRVFLEQARRILAEVDRAMAQMRLMGAGEAGSLHIGLNETVVRHALVTSAFREFRTQYPGVELKLGPIPSSKLVEAVLSGHVDAAFIYTRPPEGPVDYLRIETDDFFLALPSTHPLAARAELRLADLKDEKFLWMERESAPGVYDRMIAACQAGGLTPNIVQQVLSENTRLHLVSAGMGLTFVTSAFRDGLPESAVVTRQVADFSVPLELELVWLKSVRSPALSRFIETVKGLQDSLPPPSKAPLLRSVR